MIKPLFSSKLVCGGEFLYFSSTWASARESSPLCILEGFSCEIMARDDPGAECLLNEDHSTSSYCCIAV
jgi:hypothetical protein